MCSTSPTGQATRNIESSVKRSWYFEKREPPLVLRLANADPTPVPIRTDDPHVALAWNAGRFRDEDVLFRKK